MTFGLLSLSGSYWSTVDGSLNAPVAGSFQRPTFFTYARQSSQTYAVRPPWRVAGVDYAVGYPSRLSLSDPANIAAILGAGYSYSSNIVTVNNVVNPIIDGFDFSLHGGVGINFNSNCTGTGKVRNCNFLYGSTLNALAGSAGWIFIPSASTMNFVLEYNHVDGNATNFPSNNYVALVLNQSDSGTFLAQYNAYLNSAQDVTQTAGHGDRTERFNYAEGMGIKSHASWASTQMPSGTMANWKFSFNTGLMPNSTASGTSITEVEGNGTGLTFTNLTIDHNTLVTNLFSGSTVVSYVSTLSAVSAGQTTFTTVLFDSNYYDKTGALGFYAEINSPTISSKTFTGNLDLVTGSTWSG